MVDSPPPTAVFVHRSVDADGLSIHVAEFRQAREADPNRPGILFLHGWPENWTCFQSLMPRLSSAFNVAAIDLPGVGESCTVAPSGDKRTLARYVRAVLRELGWANASLVGHDVGGQIVFAYLKAYPDELSSAMILNVTVPGVDPWAEVERSPHIWHFGFHAVAELPERLVAGREAEYFSFFSATTDCVRCPAITSRGAAILPRTSSQSCSPGASKPSYAKPPCGHEPRPSAHDRSGWR